MTLHLKKNGSRREYRWKTRHCPVSYRSRDSEAFNSENSDRLHNNTLLHWCARLNLDRSASVLLKLNADAAAFNDAGQQAYKLCKSSTLAARLADAANGV